MDNKKFTFFLGVLIPQIIKHISEQKKISEIHAIQMFYKSKLYERLETEETKLWHLSAATLYFLFEEEITTGKIFYPEEA